MTAKIISTSPHSRSRYCYIWVTTGILLLFIQLAILLISPCFTDDPDTSSKPIVSLVILEIFAGAIFLFTVWTLRNISYTRWTFLWILAVGFLLRIAATWSTPILEDDFYRYMLDGAVSAHLSNPYSFSPEEFMSYDKAESRLPPSLRELARKGNKVISKVNHPSLRTIYPPVAQFFFACSYLLKPWSLIAWRLVIFIIDIVLLIMLILILRKFKLPLVYIAFYWWNPLYLKEIYNSAHLDVITFPFVVGSLYLAGQKYYKWSVLLLAFAVGTKIWPVLLFPLILRPVFHQPKKCLLCLLLFCFLLGVFSIPVFLSSLDSSSGFVAYGKSWEMNDAFFMLFLWGIEYIQNITNWSSFDAQFLARIVVGLLIVSWSFWIIRNPVKEPRIFFERAFLIIGFLFLLSPTQFPWYYLWILPFLAVQPRFSFLSLSVLLPIYYLRFYFEEQKNVDVFDYWIVWLEYLPLLPFFLFEFWSKIKINCVGR